MSEYKGLEWSDDNRNDRWPNYEYHEYQTICSAISAEEGSIVWEMNEVNRLVPQFWAYAQVLSKAWFVFTDGLHEYEDEWNQTVSKQIHDVCQMIKTADLLPVDYTEWYAFMKGWIDDFKTTRTRLLATRDVPAGASPAGAAGQTEAVGVSPAAEPSSALPSQSEPSVGEISTGDSAGSMTGELLEFREQQRQER